MRRGDFTLNNPDECYDLFFELAEKARQWDSMREPEPSRHSFNRGGIHRVDTSVETDAKLAIVIRRLEALEMNLPRKLETIERHLPNQVMSCGNETSTFPCTICGDPNHSGLVAH
ncbi:hypothetical protein BVC80_7343g1 [Macleaya cordata]|uniref:Uncharacterized protein n=1 Tax=Macleaya cordata TaxID=56857 RepID=A0A200QAJ5_MACCD|nr:hypothetical protein BVC80_7343g1 [Macleaya cordata]